MKLSDIRAMTQKMPDPSYHIESANMMEHVKILGLDTTAFHQELEMDSLFVDTYRDITYSNDHVQLHSHTFYEILYCRNNCGAEYLVGSERYKLQKGDVIFVSPGVSHRPILPPHMLEPYIRDVLWINPEFFTKLYPPLSRAYPENTTLLRTAGTKWEYLGEIFHMGVAEAESRGVDWDVAALGSSLTLIAHLHRAFQDAAGILAKAEKPELLDQVLVYIEQHLAEKITLSDVAHHFYISESTITQTFRKKMGVSFYRCVTQRRLIAAKGLILQGLPMDTVGERVGFTDYSSFFRAFKQEYGISPSQYKKLQSVMPDTKY